MTEIFFAKLQELISLKYDFNHFESFSYSLILHLQGQNETV